MSKQNQDTRPVYMGTYDREMKLKNMQISFLRNDLTALTKNFNLVQHKYSLIERKLLITNVISICAAGLSLIAIFMQLF